MPHNTAHWITAHRPRRIPATRWVLPVVMTLLGSLASAHGASVGAGAAPALPGDTIATASHAGPSADPRFGIGGSLYDPAAQQREIQAFRAAGLGNTRIEIRWDEVQTGDGPLVVPAAFDTEVDAFLAAGIAPVVLLDGTDSIVDGGAAPSSPAGIAAFGRFATAVATHFRGRVHAYEIWNEWANTTTSGIADPSHYIALENPTRNALENVDRSLIVVGPSSSAVGVGTPWLDPWLSAWIAAGGVADVDAVAVHPYNVGQAPETNIEPSYRALRAAIDAAPGGTDAHGVGKPIWITEQGWSTDTAEWGVTEAQQAAYLVRSAVLAQEYGVARYTAYRFEDTGDDPADPEQRFGLYRSVANGWAPKPAAVAFGVMARELHGLAFVREDPSGVAGVRVLRFSDGRRAVRVVWATGGAVGAGSVRVLLPASGSVTVTDAAGGTRMVHATLGRAGVAATATPAFVTGSGG